MTPSPTPTSTPSATPYPGFTYHLPTVRPFISLDAYTGAQTRTPTAYTTLKNSADDASAVIAAQSATATYSQYINALNSNHYSFSTADLIVMFKLTADPKYINAAIKLEDAFVTSELAASVPTTANDSYLAVGGYMEQVALTYDYGYALLSDTQKANWKTYADQILFNVWNSSSAKWNGVSKPWTGWATNDPGDNYYYSFLKATQLWSLATQNQTWITFLQTQKYTQFVPYFGVLAGGGSREGTGYGTSLRSMFENYRYWKGSTTEDLSQLTPHARDTIDYWIHATVPTLNYFASIGDQSRSSQTFMFDYQRGLMLEAVALNLGTPQAARGQWWINNISVSDGGDGWVKGKMRYNFDYRYDLLAGSNASQAPTDLAYYSLGAGAFFARNSWNVTSSWFHTVAGIFDQSHASQDQGTFSFYKNGWLSITSNYWSNSGINQDVGTHNGLRFMNGTTALGQTFNTKSTLSYSTVGGLLTVAEDLTPAYSGSGKVQSWKRTFNYQNDQLNIHDTCQVSAGIVPVFQVHTPVLPVVQPDGTTIKAGGLTITSTLPVVSKIVSMSSVNSDFKSGYRVELTAQSGCEFNVTLQAGAVSLKHKSAKPLSHKR